MAEADVENLANALCRMYSSKKAQQLGKPYRPHSRFRASGLWEKAARICIAESADPDAFIEAAFRYNTVPGGPYPQQLGGAAIVRWYKQFLRDTTAAVPVAGKPDALLSPIEQELELTLRYVAVLALEQGVEPTLMDMTLWQIPDYIRVALLPDDPNIWKRFGRSALAQLEQSPGLRKALQSKGFDIAALEARGA